jgi:hypothetical protein
MILEWYWLALIGFITLFLGMFAVWRTDFQGPKAGIKARMQDFAKQAIATAAKEHQIKLDHSTDSIAAIDTILEGFSRRHRLEPIPEKELSQIVLTWGAYVGTTLIKHHGGTWHVDSLTAGANTYPILFLKPNSVNGKNANDNSQKSQTLSEAIPVIWCLKRIRHGASESVAAKYQKIVASH